MKKILFSSILLGAFAANLTFAIAASPANSTLSPTPNWTGFYLGLNAGYDFSTNSSAYAASWGPEGFTTYTYWNYYNPNTATMPLNGVGLSQSGVIANNQNGFIGGLQTGYNYQLSDMFVLGFETDISGANISGSNNRSGGTVNFTSDNTGSATTIGGVRISSGVDWLGTVRGRAGYLFNSSLLFFGTAGLTYGGIHSNISNRSYTVYEDIPTVNYTEGVQPFFGSASHTQTLVGWNAGAGFELMMLQNWSIKAEALYWNLANVNVTTTSVAPRVGSAAWCPPGCAELLVPPTLIPAQAGTSGTSINFQGIVARAGLNYHFKAFDTSPTTSTSINSLVSMHSSVSSLPIMWSGFYAGLNAGYGFGSNTDAFATSWGQEGFTIRKQWSPTNLFMPLDGVGLSQSGIVANKQNGFIGGFQSGYNFLIKDRFVIGLEADIHGTNIGASGSRYGAGIDTNSANNGKATTVGSVQLSSGVDWLGTVRGRLGYLLNPSLLIFGTGGLTYGGVHANIVNQAYTVYEDVPNIGFQEGMQPFFGSSSKFQTLTGWNAGGGCEWMITQNWSVKTDAIYWDLGNMNVATSSIAPLIGTTFWGYSQSPRYSIPVQAGRGSININYQGIIIRTGINYHVDLEKLLTNSINF